LGAARGSARRSWTLGEADEFTGISANTSGATATNIWIGDGSDANMPGQYGSANFEGSRRSPHDEPPSRPEGPGTWGRVLGGRRGQAVGAPFITVVVR